MKMIRSLLELNFILTIYVNFKFFALRDAIKFPLFLFGPVSIRSLKGKIIVLGELKPGLVKIGKNNVEIVDRGIKTVLNIQGTLTFMGSAIIKAGTALSIDKGSQMTVGNAFSCSVRTVLIASGGANITIGNNCTFSWDILMLTSDFHNIYDKNTNAIINPARNIIIGDKVWLGSKCTVLKGSQIPDNTIVGSTCTVSGKLEKSYVIYAGNPLKVVRENIYW
jgi:acetyltransferase-like isoleucine patch superfamily enzyme